MQNSFAKNRLKIMSDDDDEEIGIADAMMMRGNRLRELRQLAELDELERGNQSIDTIDANEVTQSQIVCFLDCCGETKSVLRYESYLTHQRYYDDLKHYDMDYIDYSGVVIQQDKRLGKGGLCWDAAFILAEHLISSSNNVGWSNLSIVELGAGTGLCGILLAHHLPCHVEITDLPSLLPLMQHNVELNFGAVNDSSRQDKQILFDGMMNKKYQSGSCEAKVLEWGTQSWAGKKYHIILGADIVASLYDPIKLADTIHQLSYEQSVVYISYKGRLDGPHHAFEERMCQLYTHVNYRKIPRSRNKNPGVFILKATGAK
jgi:Lysine methyltransferase